MAGIRVYSVAAAYRHSLALTEAGRVYTWGYGAAGRLGHGGFQERYTPALVESLRDIRVVAVAAGDFHSMALTGGGRVYTWGEGEYGQLYSAMATVRTSTHQIRICKKIDSHLSNY